MNLNNLVIKEIPVNRLPVRCQNFINRAVFEHTTLHTEIVRDEVERLLIELNSYVTRRLGPDTVVPQRHVSYPKDWWQAFKEHWFPDWLKRRYPIWYTYEPVELHTYRVCPHIDLPAHADRHILFLGGELDAPISSQQKEQ